MNLTDVAFLAFGFLMGLCAAGFLPSVDAPRLWRFLRDALKLQDQATLFRRVPPHKEGQTFRGLAPGGLDDAPCWICGRPKKQGNHDHLG